MRGAVRDTILAGLAAATVVALAGCSSVSITRVRADDYETPGARYYLPRPYVAVKRSFVIGGEDHWVLAKPSSVGYQVDAAKISPRVRRLLGLDATGIVVISASSPASPVEPATAPRDGFQVQSGGAPATVATGAAPATSSSLAGSSITPALLAADKNDIEVKAKLAKDAGFEHVEKVEVGVLARGSGASFRVLSDVTVVTQYEAGSSAGEYTARGRRSDLGAGEDFAVALRFSGRKTKDDPLETIVLQAPDVALHVVGAAPAPAAPPAETSTARRRSTASRLHASGNPATEPILAINALFDVVMLPDFDQQYAVRVSAGLGSAELQVALENGWMLEELGVELDNSALGELVYESVGKVVDLGVSAASAGLTPAAAVAAVAEGFETQSAAAPPPVLLHLRVVTEALPGLYPLLKPLAQEPDRQVPADVTSLEVPLRPYGALAFNVRRQLLIEVSPSPKGGRTGANAEPLVDVVRKWLKEDPATAPAADRLVKVTCAKDALTLVVAKELVVTKEFKDALNKRKPLVASCQAPLVKVETQP